MSIKMSNGFTCNFQQHVTKGQLSFVEFQDLPISNTNIGSAQTPDLRATLATLFFNLHSGGWNQGPLDIAAT
jgi:hypothetical protein